MQVQDEDSCRNHQTDRRREGHRLYQRTPRYREYVRQYQHTEKWREYISRYQAATNIYERDGWPVCVGRTRRPNPPV